MRRSGDRSHLESCRLRAAAKLPTESAKTALEFDPHLFAKSRSLIEHRARVAVCIGAEVAC